MNYFFTLNAKLSFSMLKTKSMVDTLDKRITYKRIIMVKAKDWLNFVCRSIDFLENLLTI